ncbi:MAG: hypothetical protein ACFNNL_11300, partial [Kingella oralis]
MLVLVLFTSCLRIRALNIGCFFRLPTASQIARQSKKRFSGCISHRFSINRQPENHTVNPAANAYPKAQILFQVAFNERLPQSTNPLFRLPQSLATIGSLKNQTHQFHPTKEFPM